MKNRKQLEGMVRTYNPTVGEYKSSRHYRVRLCLKTIFMSVCVCVCVCVYVHCALTHTF
jgi:hypothetical protein